MGIDARNMALIGHNDLGGQGDGMHVNVVDGHAFVGHQGHSAIGTSVVDVSDPENPRLVAQIARPPGTHSHKLQIVGDVMAVNHERNRFESTPAARWSAGLAVYDISDPSDPKQIGFFETPGTGVHRMTYWEEPHAFLSASAEGFLGRILLVVDLSDPSQPREVGRWWFPGQNQAAGETLTWTPPAQDRPGPGEKQVIMHHGLPDGDRLYCGWWDGGLVILDISDLEQPKLVSHLEFGEESSETHTALPVPGRNLLVVTDEAVTRKLGLQKHVRIVDISNESDPEVIAKFPVPSYDYHERGIRYGPHNLHEHRPGSLLDPNTAYLTYFAGGIRAYDISDARAPREIAHLVPEVPPRLPDSPPSAQGAAQFNDVTVDAQGLIYVTDRFGGGLYIVEHERSAA
ncbi:MAG: LVIVD repeat-containing protein [Acidimicrobiales bacterium]